ncbi:MAG TPA: hypothetical protein VIG98_11670, partial [Bacillus sp. (in: firmicutes)]
SVYKGSRGKGKKGHTVHRLTETGLECLARHGMSVEVQSPQLYVRPNQMHYLTMANDVMVDLTLAGWEVWDSRKVKREYNLDKKMNISGLLSTSKKGALEAILEARFFMTRLVF